MNAFAALAPLATSSAVDEPSMEPTKPPADTVDRKCLWSGGIIELFVPVSAKLSIYKSPTLNFQYLHFSAKVTGGVIHIHVRGDLPTRWKGTQLTARVELWEKILHPDVGYFYIDLYPEKTTPTHAMAIVGADAAGDLPAWCEEEGRELFVADVPPLKAAVVFTPLRGQQATVAQSGDSQLDRYLADGWQIDHEEDTAVILWKMKKGERSEIIHHRPKKK